MKAQHELDSWHHEQHKSRSKDLLQRARHQLLTENVLTRDSQTRETPQPKLTEIKGNHWTKQLIEEFKSELRTLKTGFGAKGYNH